MNNLAISLKKFFTNKNTVTIIGVVAILVILYFLYTSTVNNATEKVQVPVAANTINPQTQITAEDVTYVEVANAAKPDDVIMNDSEIIGKYTGVGMTVPQGSMFYAGVVVEKEDLPGSWLKLLEKDALGNLQKPYYFPVNVTTTFGNSIQPGDYVDFYVKTYNEQDVLMFGRMIENVKVLAVTDSDGQNVFRSQGDIGDPAFLDIGLSDELHDVFRKSENINEVEIELIVVPHGGAVPETDLEVNVSSEYLRDFIGAHSAEIPKNAEAEDATTPEGGATTPATTTPATTPAN